MSVVTAFQYFAVAGFINAIVLSLLLLTHKKSHLSKQFMVGLVIVVTFQAILNAFDNREFFLKFPHLSKISWLAPSLFGPLVYLFTVKLCSARPGLYKRDLLHFIPFLVYLVVLLPWFLTPAAEKRAYLNDFEAARKDDFGLLNQLSILIILVYLIFTLVYLKKFRRTVENTYSEVSQKRVEWMSTFAYGVLGVLFISAVGFYGHKWQVPVLDAIYHYNYALVVLLVYWIAYKALLQPVIFERPPLSAGTFRHSEVNPEPAPEIPEEVSEIKKYTRSGLEEAHAEHIYESLVDFMKTKKPYLDPEINIYQLAGMLNFKKHHLSQVINEKAEMNFFDFINTFRVEETKRNLTDPSMKNMTLLGVALESGFNSKATFNAAFKKFTGLTPSEFQKRLKKEV
jgi:AraC-like DNA-binding protein